MLFLQNRSALMCFSFQPVYLFITGGCIGLNWCYQGKIQNHFCWDTCKTHVIIVFVCRGWPQMLSSHWHSVLFGPGSYCTTPPWRQCWSFCVSTRPVSPQVCICMFFYRRSACLCESHTFRTEGNVVVSPGYRWATLCLTVYHQGRLPASHNKHAVMATVFRPRVWKMKPLCVGCHMFLGQIGNANLMWPM